VAPRLPRGPWGPVEPRLLGGVGAIAGVARGAVDHRLTARQRTTRPQSVFACGAMAWPLYAAPPTRAMYLQTLRATLDTVWDEDAIVGEIDRLQALLAPFADPTGSGAHAARLDAVRWC
jgi:hypothetical protein